MGFQVKGGGRLEDRIDDGAARRAARRIADAGTDRLQINVKRNTPIDTSPFRDKPGRPRGTLRRSIDRTPITATVTAAGDGFIGRVFTLDPIARYVEWDTRPHIIEPRNPDGHLAWRDGQTGARHVAKSVRHPGTKGQHMFSLGEAKTEAELAEVALLPLRQFEREVIR